MYLTDKKQLYEAARLVDALAGGLNEGSGGGYAAGEKVVRKSTGRAETTGIGRVREGR
jgi:hypothetical protein